MTIEDRLQLLEKRVQELEDNLPRLKKPTFEEVYGYMRQKLVGTDGFVQEQSQSFMDHYISNGWKVGKTPMKNWQAAVRNWVKNIKNKAFNANNTRNIGQQSLSGEQIRGGGYGRI